MPEDRGAVGLMLVQPDGTVGWANERAGALLGWDDVREGDPRWRALRGETVHGARTQARDPDGREVVLDVTALPVGTEHGGALIVVSDATERDRVERADAEFVENAAHQLRTPITAIVSSVAALEAGAIDEPGERERFLAHIGRESRRMATMVEALLRLASLERGTGRPLIELVPLRLLLDEVLGACGIAPARCECRAEIAVVGARGLLAQALANVLSNAAHHAGPDGLVVRAALERATVTLDVTDSGPGVPSDERDRIFERFYRGSGRGPGSGLGLALARTAIEASRGTLELLPQRPGEGATFRFTLPGAQLL